MLFNSIKPDLSLSWFIYTIWTKFVNIPWDNSVYLINWYYTQELVTKKQEINWSFQELQLADHNSCISVLVNVHRLYHITHGSEFLHGDFADCSGIHQQSYLVTRPLLQTNWCSAWEELCSIFDSVCYVIHLKLCHMITFTCNDHSPSYKHQVIAVAVLNMKEEKGEKNHFHTHYIQKKC